MTLERTNRRRPGRQLHALLIAHEVAALAFVHARVPHAVMPCGAQGALVGQEAAGRAGAQPPSPRLAGLSQGGL